MEIRYLTEDDRAAFESLIAEAFMLGKPIPVLPKPEPLHEGWQNTKRLGMFRGDRLIASALTHQMHLHWDFGSVPMGGVAAVTCTAAERGQGHVDKLLRKALVDMRECGQYFSGLHPFQYSFYKRYGYGWVGERYVTTFPVSDLKSDPEGRNLQTFEGLDAKPLVEPVYAEFCKRYRGMHLRQGVFPDWWARNLKNPSLGPYDTTAYVHLYTNPSSGKAEGYLVYRYEPERDKGNVGEFVALTPEAQRALLSVLHYYGTQIKTVTLETPSDDPLPLYVMTHDVERKVKPHFMARIVDLKPALEALKPDSNINGTVVIQVDDPICEWNNDVFKIEIESGNVAITSSTGTPDVSLNIEQLTQAYWGLPTLAMMRRAGMIAVSNEAGYEMLGKLLPETVTYMSEFF